ncbi:MAG: ferritin-like domain-containing protein [Candidatus Bathyarchaeota archaeon]|nr:ferritin-like domain-containing protein [Candidatus Bathyarchaeota archaeon]
MSWKVLDESALEKIREQKEFEDQTAKKLTPLFQSAKNPLIKLYLHSIILDTMRHSDTYQMILELNDTALVGQQSQALGKQELTAHINEEAKMLKQTQDLIQTTTDPKIKQLLQNILEDEQKHHKTLTNILDILQKESKEWNKYLYDLIEGFP